MKFTKKILKNGIRVITVPMAENPTVTVLVMVEAGSKYERREISGISHFLEHLCFKGTTKRPKAIDISRELDSIGSHYNAFTSHEFTGYYAKADKQHLGVILDVVSDIYLNSTFPEKEIEKEKGVIVEEINMYRDLPARHVQDLFMELLYGDQPAGWNIAGTKETVMGMQKQMLHDYRAQHYVSGSTIVVVAGCFNEETIFEWLEKTFVDIHRGSKHPKTKVEEKQTEPALLVQYKKTDQTHLALGVRTFDVYHKSNSAVRVLGGILGGGMSSRLFQKLREEMGVGYYVSASHDTYTDHGFFEISAGIDSKRLLEVTDAILTELRNIRDIEVPPEELKKTKDYLTGSMYLSLESSDALAEYYGYQEILKKDLRRPEEIVKEIQAVTAEDVMEVARKIFVSENLNLALVGPIKNTKRLERCVSL